MAETRPRCQRSRRRVDGRGRAMCGHHRAVLTSASRRPGRPERVSMARRRKARLRVARGDVLPADNPSPRVGVHPCARAHDGPCDSHPAQHGATNPRDRRDRARHGSVRPNGAGNGAQGSPTAWKGQFVPVSPTQAEEYEKCESPLPSGLSRAVAGAKGANAFAGTCGPATSDSGEPWRRRRCRR